MTARENEMRLLVLAQSKCGWLVRLYIVATVAGIEVGCCGKLFRMPIAMTIGAAVEFDFEKCVSPFRDMALRAF